MSGFSEAFYYEGSIHKQMSKSVVFGQPITIYARHHSLSSLTLQYLGSTARAKANQEIVLRRLGRLDLMWETWKKAR